MSAVCKNFWIYYCSHSKYNYDYR